MFTSQVTFSFLFVAPWPMWVCVCVGGVSTWSRDMTSAQTSHATVSSPRQQQQQLWRQCHHHHHPHHHHHLTATRRHNGLVSVTPGRRHVFSSVTCSAACRWTHYTCTTSLRCSAQSRVQLHITPGWSHVFSYTCTTSLRCSAVDRWRGGDELSWNSSWLDVAMTTAGLKSSDSLLVIHGLTRATGEARTMWYRCGMDYENSESRSASLVPASLAEGPSGPR